MDEKARKFFINDLPHDKITDGTDAMIKEMETMVEGMDELLKKSHEDEQREQELAKPLPEKLYHVTTRINANQILKEGIDTSKLYFSDDEVASLSDSIDFAKSVVSVTQNSHVNNLVVLEIDTKYLTPSRIKNFLRKKDPSGKSQFSENEIHEVHYYGTIPPEAIKIIK